MATVFHKRHQTKTQVVCDQLASLAAQLGPNGRFPTLAELRVELGVSLTTLDGALRDMERRGLIYRMHGIGVFVAPPQQKTVGLVYAVRHTYGSPFWDMLVEHMRLRAEAGHERFRIYMTHPMPGESVPLPRELVEAVEGRQLQGVIFIGDQNKAGVEWLEAQKVPMVTFATPRGTYRVQIARETMVQLGVQEMARRGCKRIALWVPFGAGVRYDQRSHSHGLLEVFQTALQRENLPYRDEAAGAFTTFWTIPKKPVPIRSKAYERCGKFMPAKVSLKCRMALSS
jgi:DNA-binding transcriptional regulator YhcF (GntR family)